jgi:hypothetical protein
MLGFSMNLNVEESGHDLLSQYLAGETEENHEKF